MLLIIYNFKNVHLLVHLTIFCSIFFHKLLFSITLNVVRMGYNSSAVWIYHGMKCFRKSILRCTLLETWLRFFTLFFSSIITAFVNSKCWFSHGSWSIFFMCTSKIKNLHCVIEGIKVTFYLCFFDSTSTQAPLETVQITFFLPGIRYVLILICSNSRNTHLGFSLTSETAVCYFYVLPTIVPTATKNGGVMKSSFDFSTCWFYVAFTSILSFYCTR